MDMNDAVKVQEHYKDIDELLIVGLGDDRGVNFQKNLLLLLKKLLTSNRYDIKTIDGFSMLYNKNRHIDYYLKHNISSEQLKSIQIQGSEEEIIHALGDKYISSLIGVVGSKKIKSANEEELYLSDEIKNSKDPIIIYSSGINDIMYETQINPFSIKDKYQNYRAEYDYSVSLVKGEKKNITMTKIMDGHKNNIENILGLNEQSKICVLGAYIYSNNKYEEPFNNFVLNYNEKLKELCREYEITYTGTRSIEKTDYRSITNTYLKKLSYYFASRIIRELSFSIDNERNIDIEPLEYDNSGAFGMLMDMKKYSKDLKKNNKFKYLNVKEELDREEKVIEKVLFYK